MEREHVKFFVFHVFVCIGCAACSSRGNNSHPFDMGSKLARKPLEPIIEVLRPVKTIKISKLDLIEFNIRMTLPEGGSLPSNLVVEYYQNDRIAGSGGEVRPASRSGNSFLFEARLRGPVKRGIFSAVINAIYHIDANLPGEASPEKLSSFYYIAHGPKIEVR